LNAEVEAGAPVLISHEDAVPSHRDVMINLGDEVPRGHDQFQRLAELIDQDSDTKNAGRKRYRAYQALGYDIHTHELGAAD
jgi:DNA polymerase-3 subunit chi